MPQGTKPFQPVAWSDQRMRSGWLVVCAACVLYLTLLPGAIVNADEFHYAGQARALMHGRLIPATSDPVAAVRGQEHEGLRFPVGWPLALATARPFGFRAMYLVPMLLHLAAGVAFARLAVRRGVPAWANALYLFHPVIWGLSRTIMSDVPAVALAVIAIDAWEAGRSWVPGGLLAYGMLVRMGGVFTTAGFGLAALRDLRREPRRFVGLALPALAAVAIQLAVNRLTSGQFTSSYTDKNVLLLDGSRIGEHLALYAAGLFLLPPFPLAALAVRSRSAESWCMGAIPTLAFFLAYAYHDESPRLVEAFVGGQRLVLAAHAFLMIGTLAIWGRLVQRLKLPVLAAGLAAAVAASLGLERIREQYDEAARVVASCRPGRIGYDYDAGKVVAGIDATGWRFLDGSDPAGQDDVVVVTRQLTTNRATNPVPRPLPPELEPHRDRCRAVGRFQIYDLAGRCGDVGEQCP